MAIFGEIPDPIPEKTPATVKIHSDPFRSSLVDSKEHRPESLLVHLDGFPWTVEYYSQQVGEDEELSPLQIGQLPVYQQYIRIKDLEIRVTSPLSTSQNEPLNTMEVTGSANTFPFMIPNVGDIFLADIGDGRTGVFVITESTRMSFLKQTTYEISYQLNTILTDEINVALEERVIKTVYFKKDLLKNSQLPFLVEEDHTAKIKMENYIETFLRRYMIEFFSNDFSTFLVPRQPTPTYDHYLTRTMLRLFDPHDTPRLRRVRELNIDGERLMSTLNVWDTILEMDNGFGGVVTQKTWLVPAALFNKWPRLEGVRFSGIQYIVYPHLPLKPVDNGYVPYVEKNGKAVQPIGDFDWELVSVIQNIQPGGLENPNDPTEPEPDPTPIEDTAPTPPIHPIGLDNYYIFSEAFYKKADTGQSLIELLTHDTIDDNAIDFNMLFRVCEDVEHWGALERYYYIPILMALMKVKLRRL